MNKRCYRIIFSKTLSCLVVLSELAKTAGKAVTGFVNGLSATRLFRQKTPDFSLHIAALTCFIGLGIIYVPQTMAQPAEIHADRSAPSATDGITHGKRHAAGEYSNTKRRGAFHAMFIHSSTLPKKVPY